jgi:DNA-binding transcriptional MerR regulator/methylmalonyl-CoA mutase cobalamin-binding subunit
MQASETQPRYPIRIAVRRTGLSPHVLRAWERRYAVVQPGRDAAGGRLYSEADIARFRLLRQATEAGHAIGRVAPLSTEELLALVGGDASPESPVETLRPDSEAGRFVRAALRALEEMDAARLHATLIRAVVALPSQGFTDGVVLPLLHQVGDLWARGRISPAHEHVLSAQLGRVLGWLADSLPVAPGAPEAVAVAPRGQRHEFGALLAAVAAAEEGWRVTYLGPDLPAPDIATAVRVRRARVVLVSAVLRDDDGLYAELREIREAVGKTPVLVGGLAATAIPETVRRAGATPLADLHELRRALASIHPGRAE